MNRRGFLRVGVAGSAGMGMVVRGEAGSGVAAPELAEVSISGLRKAIDSGKWSVADIVAGYLARIEALDRSGPAINSVIEVNPDALSIARQLDDERLQGRGRGPLHGIPILIKDNIDTADRMRTSAGSLALAESIAARDAFVAERLRAAGAVILGKTNLSEWANFRSSRSTSGWSGRGGQTRNPYALDRNPCGSSSGSGAAVAASLCAAAIGTETDGSIVCPSNANSLVGIKPTLGLISRSGIIPISHSQDTAGPMARTVTDAAILLSALTGVDPRDAATRSSRSHIESDYTRFLDPRGLKGARIGIARNYFGFNERVDKLLEEALDVMKRQGAILVDPVNDPTRGEYDESELEVMLYEFKADLNAYLKTAGPGAVARTIDQVIEFNEKNRAREMQYFGQEIMIRAAAKGPLTEPAYRRALARNLRLSRTNGIDAMIRTHRLDAIVAPTGGTPWLTDFANGDHFSGGFSTAAAVAGYPHLTVPAGYLHGLPVGISFFGGAWTEGRLIRIAYAFEQASKYRKAPRFLPTAVPDM
jgi:amidase